MRDKDFVVVNAVALRLIGLELHRHQIEGHKRSQDVIDHKNFFMILGSPVGIIKNMKKIKKTYCSIYFT
jgi:hypothetical protein